MTEPKLPRHAKASKTDTPFGEPLRPWYRNERLKFVTRLTTAGAMRLMILSMVVFAIIVAIGGNYLVDLGSSNRQLNRDIKDTINKRTQDRLEFQRSIQKESNQNTKNIQELACFAANSVPRGVSKFADGLAVKYHCQPK